MLALDDDDLELLQPWFTPESPGAITIGPHVINTGYGNAWVDRWPEPRAVLVEAATNYVLRGDPGALTAESIRPHIQGFVDASPAFAPLLRAAFDDMVVWDRVVYALRQKARWAAPSGFVVRRLTWEDAGHLERLSPESNWIYKTWVTPANLAASGYAWGAFAGGRLVSVANIFFLGNEYEEIGVVSEPEFRGLGLNTACAGALCQDIHKRGHIPSWTTSHDNIASKRVAEKLGFEFARNDVLYVIGIKPPAPSQREPTS
jgi:RimJ/RimL family protein N-acetyltransferase